MRIRIRYMAVVFFLAAFSLWAFAQEERSGERPRDGNVVTLQEIPSSLGEMLARALEANPDILVAEADLHHAQAVVRHVRLEVSREVIETFHTIKVRRSILKGAEAEYRRMEQLEESGRLPSDSLFPHRQAVTKAEAAVVEVEARIRGLIGQDPSSGKIPASLEEILAVALRSNGEVMLAEADLVRMDTRLNRTRLEVVEEVTVTYQTARVNKIAIDHARMIFQRMVERVNQGIVSKDEELIALQAKMEAEAELARVEAHVRYLLGLGGTLHSGKAKKTDPSKK